MTPSHEEGEMVVRLAAVVMLLLAVACGEDAATTTPAEDAGVTEAADTGSGTTVTVASSDLGDVLADGDGRTLYLFRNDNQGDSTCYDDCAANWPALVGEVQAGEGVDEALLATVQRDDGESQVTYNDWPLYYYAGDSEPGDTNGQGVGEVWFAVTPAGDAVAQADGGGYAEY